MAQKAEHIGFRHRGQEQLLESLAYTERSREISILISVPECRETANPPRMEFEWSHSTQCAVTFYAAVVLASQQPPFRRFRREQML